MATMLNAHITHLDPRYLFLIRWACKLAGCKVKAWKARVRKEKADG